MPGLNLAALLAAGHDESGARLAAVIRASHGENGAAPRTPLNGNSPTPADFMAAKSGSHPWRDIPATLAAEGRNNGVMRLAASLRETTSLTDDQAVAEMYEKVWPLIDQSQGGHEFPAAEFEEVIRAVWRQYPGAAEKIAASVAAAPAEAVDGVPSGPPLPHSLLDLTETFLTRWVAWTLGSAHGSIGGPYRWAPGLGWMRWRGTRWAAADPADVWNELRQYFMHLLNAVASAGGADQALLAKLVSLQSKAKISAMTELARGHELIRCEAADFDAHPDLINTPGGVVDLRDGSVRPHDPALLLTKITSGNYRPGYTHPDWELALTALDAPEREWYQSRIGQAVTGYPPADGIMPVLQGSGENGKTVCTTDGPGKALGDYADMASHKLITSQKAGSSEHSTELADLRGQRLLIGEELSEGRSIDVTALKRIMDVGRIKARYVHKDNITFDASHSLFCTTNYRPVISETDHGTWRRLALLVFPYTFRKPGEALITPLDRRGDPELKQRIKQNLSGQHDAIVTWAVQGAMRWYGRGRTSPLPTERILADTRAWRATADHVLGFWHEFLEADHGEPGDIHVPCIGGTHLRSVFNAWLGRNGHNPWTKQTFAARFGEHETTTSRSVEYRQTRALGHLSVYAGRELSVPADPPSRVMWCWIGVRYKTPDELGKDVESHGRHGSQGNYYTRRTQDNLPEIRDMRDTEICSNDFTPPEAASPAFSHLPAPNTLRSKNAAGKVSETSVTSVTSVTPPKTRKVKPTGPDPELEGAILSLPAVVLRDGDIWPCTVPEAFTALDRLRDALTVDVETTGYPPGHPEYGLRTVQLGGEHFAVDFDASDADSRLIIRHLLGKAPVLHAHSASADLVPLLLDGLCDESAWARMHDTVLSAKLADPEMSGSDADGLKALAADVLKERAVTPAANEARKKLFASGKWLTDTAALTPPERSGWAQVNPACATMIRYAASDVLDTAALPGVLPVPDRETLDRERAVQRICARVSYRGLRLDGAHVHELITEHEAGKAIAGARVKACGIDNPGSGKQVGAALTALGALLPMTDKGNVSASGTVLEALAAVDDEPGHLAADVLEYREHATILGLTLEPFRLLCDKGDGRVRPVIYTLGTATGRMSAVRPNLQQIKRTGGIRACVTADEGTVIVSADFAGVELRVAAALSGDVALIGFIAEEDAHRGKDAKVGLHWKVAHQVWGLEATKANRYAVKRAVFGHVYGGSVRAMANGAGISLADAEAVKDTLTELTPQLMQWSADLSRAVRDGRATAFPAWGGRQVWFDRRAPHKAGNYAIQGTARELLCRALLEWEKTPWGSSVILPVHDEILAVVPEADGPAATAALVRCMEMNLYGVPVVAEPSVPSFAWQDAD